MKKFRVAIAVEIDGRTYAPGATIELDPATAKLYNHALRSTEAAPAAAGRLATLEAEAAKLASDIAAAEKESE